MTDVECTIKERIAHIRFVSPERANALRKQTFDELKEIARSLHQDPDIGAIVISGEGPIFCAGGDLKAFAVQEQLGDFVYDMATTFHASLDYFNRTDAPVIAAVEGGVGGAGVSLMAACDLAVVAENASFTLGYSAIGLTPDGSASYYLSRAVGLRRALDLALTNRTIDAKTACEWGLVTRLATPGDALDQAMSLARQLADRDTLVLGESKRLLVEGTDRNLREAMARETEKVSSMAARPEVKTYIDAFLNRKRPARDKSND
jgi:2-(1,2-epoxy-1,2-dihydrophenyl)acetyl-CoA isomerase